MAEKLRLMTRSQLAPLRTSSMGRDDDPRHSHPFGDRVTGSGSRALRSGFSCSNRMCCLGTGVGMLLVGALLMLLPEPEDALGPRSDFVRVTGTKFELHCRPFYVAGFNAEDLAYKALVTPDRHLTPGNETGLVIVERTIRQAAAAQLNVMRVFAHTTSPEFPMQERAGRLNRSSAAGLDAVLDAARRAGIRAILSLADNWKYAGGTDETVDWSATAPRRVRKRPLDVEGDARAEEYDSATEAYETRRHALFFHDEGARQIYKDWARALAMRRNTVNGRVYRDDPTIFGWNLLNEPRCEVAGCEACFPAWVEEMAAHMKEVAPRQLVTIGQEGFFATNGSHAGINPAAWAAHSGQDFGRDHRIPGIDFATLHVWPDNWHSEIPDYLKLWTLAHIQEAEEHLHKPLLLQEFGKIVGRGRQQDITTVRDPVFEKLYGVVADSIEMGRALQGSLFWKWYVQVYQQDADEARPSGYGVALSDSTFSVIRRHAAMVRQRTVTGAPEPICAQAKGQPCWVPQVNNWCRSCVKRPAAECKRRWQEQALQAQRPSEQVASGLGWAEVYAGRAACCNPGLGAFAKGCTFSLWHLIA